MSQNSLVFFKEQLNIFLLVVMFWHFIAINRWIIVMYVYIFIHKQEVQFFVKLMNLLKFEAWSQLNF